MTFVINPLIFVRTKKQKNMKVKGRQIFDGAGIKVGEITGNRPHVNDLHKGARCNFGIKWTSGEYTPLPFQSYLKDVIKYAKGL